MSTKQKVWPWLIVIGWAFISAASIELILIGGSNYFRSVSEGIGAPIPQIALMMTACTIALSICSPIAGRLFAKIDSRILLTIMGIGVILGYMSLSFGQNAWQWFAVGIVYGVFGSGIFIIGGPIFISNWFKTRTGVATGTYSCLLAVLSMTLQPQIANCINTFGWRQSYLIMGAVSAIMLFPFTLFIERFTPEEMGLKPYGWDQVQEGAEEKKAGPGVPYKKAVTSLAFVLLVIGAGMECNLGGFKSNWNTIATSDAWAYMQAGHTMEEAIAFGALMLTATNGAKLTGPIFGWIADKIGGALTMVICAGCCVVGMFLIWQCGSIEALVLLGCFLWGMDSVMMKTVIPLSVRDIFGEKEYNKIYSFLYGIINFLGAFATSLIALMGETGGWTGVFILGISLSAGTLIFTLAARVAGKKLVWED